MKAKLMVIAIAVVITVLFLGFAQFSYAQQNTTFEEKNTTQAKAKGTTIEKYKQTLKEYESPTGKKMDATTRRQSIQRNDGKKI